jgi:branched-chain amino acid transport system ATP-binding protein
MMLQPSLVLLDEPFNGINPALIEKLLEMIRIMNTRAGVTFVLVSHEMPHVSDLCHSVSVLAAGRTLITGKPDEVRADSRVIEAYLGH